MNRTTIKDERIQLERRRIQSDAYGILVYGLIACIFIQQFFLKAPVSQLLGEVVCLAGIVLYISVRQFSAGIDIWSRPNQTAAKTVLNSVVTGLIVTAFLILIAGEQNVLFVVSFFVCFTISSFFVSLLMQNLNKKKRSKIEAELNNAESEEEDVL